MGSLTAGRAPRSRRCPVCSPSPSPSRAPGKGTRPRAVLFPEWMGVFYQHGRAENASPILALRPVLSNDAFGGVWVDAAIGHMGFYGLPRKLAEQFVAKGTAPL